MNKKKIIIISSIIVALVLLIAGVSYAFYSARVNEINKTETVIKTNELTIVYTGTQEINVSNIVPGDSFTKTFTVENTSNVPVTYNIYMEKVLNEFNEDLVFELKDEDKIVLSDEMLPSTNSEKSYLKTGITIGAKKIKKYTLTVKFNYSDKDQNNLQGASFNGTLGIDTTPIDIVKVVNEIISFNNLEEGKTITKNFEVKNISDLNQVYDLNLNDITNDYVENLTFDLIKNDEEVLINQTITGSEMTLLKNQSIEPNSLDKYTIKFNISNSVSLSENMIELLANDTKQFNATISVDFSSINIKKGESLLSLLKTENTNDSAFIYSINGEQYSVHYYTFDGDQKWTEDMEFGNENDVGSETENAKNMVIVKVKGDLTIDEGVTVKAFGNEYGGPKGFSLYVTGKLTNNGIITVSENGAKADGQNVYLLKNEDGTYDYVPAEGAAASSRSLTGTSNYLTAGKAAGKAGEGRQTGGGSSGSASAINGSSRSSGGAGGIGTSYSGGAGGGGASTNASNCTKAVTYGEDANYYIAGKGKTNFCNGLTSGSAGTGAAPGGGLLILYANDILNNGEITSYGKLGPGSLNAYKSGSKYYSNSQGGDSGGGSINIFYNNNLENNGTMSATLSTLKSGAGTVTTTKIN